MLGLKILNELSNLDLKFALSYVTKKIQKSDKPYQIKVVGNSMLPTIKDGSKVYIIPIGSHSCKVGDVVCYNNSHHFVLHRIVSIIEENGKILYRLKGDNLPNFDYRLVSKEQIIGYCEEKIFPYINIIYSCGDTINIITDLSEVRNFIFNMCSKSIINKDVYVEKVYLNIIIYRENGVYIIEIYNRNEREKIYINTLIELKGSLYSIIFHADAIKERYRDCIALHAGGVCIKDKIMCIIGKTGQGKSTILYWLAKKNFKYLGDESFYIRINSCKDAQTIIPFYTPIMLRKDVLNFVDDKSVLEETLIKKEHGLEKKYAICVENILLDTANADVIFVIPHWSKTCKLKVEKLSFQQAYEVLVANIQNSFQITGETFKKLLKLAANFSFYEIQYSNNDDFLSGFLNEIK